MAALRARAWAMSLGAVTLAAACLVPDVELTDTLPGRGGSSSMAGSAVAGSDPMSDAGEGSGDGGDGGSSSVAGSANQGGDPQTAGSAGASSGTAGSAGSAGTAGAGGSAPVVEIPALNACPNPAYFICDDFESGAGNSWLPGTQPTQITDAPSGQNVLLTDYAAPNQLSLQFNTIKISFWVRLQAISDQRFLSFPNDVNGKFGLGIEGSRLHWMFESGAGQAGAVVAPSDIAKTRIMTAGTWFCAEVAIDGLGIFETRVVVPGSAAFVLPSLDGVPTPGEDQQWNMSYANWYASGDGIIFGQAGSYAEFDDVMIGEYDQQSVCDLYLAAVDN